MLNCNSDYFRQLEPVFHPCIDISNTCVTDVTLTSFSRQSVCMVLASKSDCCSSKQIRHAMLQGMSYKLAQLR